MIFQKSQLGLIFRIGGSISQTSNERMQIIEKEVLNFCSILVTFCFPPWWMIVLTFNLNRNKKNLLLPLRISSSFSRSNPLLPNSTLISSLIAIDSWCNYKSRVWWNGRKFDGEVYEGTLFHRLPHGFDALVEKHGWGWVGAGGTFEIVIFSRRG